MEYNMKMETKVSNENGKVSCWNKCIVSTIVTITFIFTEDKKEKKKYQKCFGTV